MYVQMLLSSMAHENFKIFTDLVTTKLPTNRTWRKTEALSGGLSPDPSVYH